MKYEVSQLAPKVITIDDARTTSALAGDTILLVQPTRHSNKVEDTLNPAMDTVIRYPFAHETLSTVHHPRSRPAIIYPSSKQIF